MVPLFVEVANASCSVHPPPIPLNVMVPPNAFPAEVMVCPVVVASKLTGPVKFRVMVGESVNEPYIFNKFTEVKVEARFMPVQSMFLQLAVGMSMVTVWLSDEKEFTSKNTLSSDVGAHPDGDPPLLVAQWFPSLQFPEFPIQYKFAESGEVIVQPVLFPKSMELLALKVAPPVAVI